MSLENPSAYEIQNVLAIWREAQNSLLREDPDPDPYAAETADLDTTTQDVRSLLERILRAARRSSLMAKQAGEMIADLELRQDRYRAREGRLRETAKQIMELTGTKKLELPDMTAAMRSGAQRAIVTDETKIPTEFIEEVTVRKVKKAELLAELKEGVLINGATLGNSSSNIQLTVK